MATIGSSQRMRYVGPEPPGTPGDFAATKSTTASKTINLSWSAATKASELLIPKNSSPVPSV